MKIGGDGGGLKRDGYRKREAINDIHAAVGDPIAGYAAQNQKIHARVHERSVDEAS